jgi:hypothetical protein
MTAPQHMHICDRCDQADAQAKGWEWPKTDKGSFALCADCLKYLRPKWESRAKFKAMA